MHYFSTGLRDTFSLHGITNYDKHFNLSWTKYKRNESSNDKVNTESRIKKQTLYTEKLAEENMYLLTKFSTTYSTSPNIKVVFYGNDHRSWIDIVVSYNEIFRDLSSFDIKYLHKIIQHSNSLDSNYLVNTLPNVKDQVLVFIRDNPTNNMWENGTLDMTIRGNSYKIYRFFPKNTAELKRLAYAFVMMNLILRWNVKLQIVPGLQYSMSLQGSFHQLQTNFVLNCKTNELCSPLKVYWIPDQLHKYRGNADKMPHSCLQQPQMDLPDISCLHFILDSSVQYYYFYNNDMGPFEINFGINKKRKDKSWNYAFSVCQDMGGVLPMIRNKPELDKLISFVILSPYIPPQDKIFIGLSAKTKSKVQLKLYIFNKAMGFFPNGAELSLNSGNSENLRNH